jgi:hypothetical protein
VGIFNVIFSLPIIFSEVIYYSGIVSGNSNQNEEHYLLGFNAMQFCRTLSMFEGIWVDFYRTT